MIYREYSATALSLVLILCEDTGDILGGKSSVHVTVDGENGSKTASTDATRCLQRILTVSRGASVRKIKLLRDLLKQITRALNVASGAEADRNCILSVGVKLELCIEGYDTVDLLKGRTGLSCDYLLNLDGQITVDLLCLLKDGHHCSLHTFVFCDHGKELFFLLLGSAELDSRQ